MRRTLPVGLISLGVVLAVVGCGGKKTYSLESTKTCLKKNDLKMQAPKDDFVASTASGGALRVVLGKRQEVTISFADSEQAAARLVQGYQRFAGKNIGLADVLRPQRNAVLLWEAHPSDKDLAAIGRCLK